LVTRAGRLPVRGEIVPGPDLFEFEVLDADPRRVKRVRIIRLKERRERPRETRKRNEADGMFSSVAPSPTATDDKASRNDTGPAGVRQP
jgi:hypothetical protein